MSHETGAGQYVTEIAKGVYWDNSWNNGCNVPTQPPDQAHWFYGRGWLQISWNGNYASASHFAHGPSDCSYVTTPSILETDEPASTVASVWYWMTQNGPFTKSAHAGIIDDQSFGNTIKSINGALECPSLGGSNTAQRDHRSQLYNSFVAS